MLHGCIRKYGRVLETDPCNMTSEDSAVSPGSLQAQTSCSEAGVAASNWGKLEPFPNWDEEVPIRFQWACIWMYTSTAATYPLFCIPTEGLAFRIAWSKQKQLSLQLVPLRPLAGRAGLSWHPLHSLLSMLFLPLPGHFIPHSIRF